MGSQHASGPSRAAPPEEEEALMLIVIVIITIMIMITIVTILIYSRAASTRCSPGPGARSLAGAGSPARGAAGERGGRGVTSGLSFY